VKKDLFSQKFRVLVTLFGFSDTHSIAGVLSVDTNDEPPVVVTPPTK